MTIAWGMLTFFIPSTDMARVPARLGEAGATVKPGFAVAPPGTLAVAIGALAQGERGAPAAGTATGACTGDLDEDDMGTRRRWRVGAPRSVERKLCACASARRASLPLGNIRAQLRRCRQSTRAGRPRAPWLPPLQGGLLRPAPGQRSRPRRTRKPPRR